MPEIIIQADGSLLIPRGKDSDNKFFRELLAGIVDSKEMESVNDFFAVSEDSEILFGSPGLCG